MKNYNAIEGMITESQSILQNRLYVAYDRGYEQGLKDNSEEAYQRGLDDAWEAARKITCMWDSEQFDIFNEHEAVNIFGCNTAFEAISKIKAYEEKKKAEQEEVKVGDRVRTIKDQDEFGHCLFPIGTIGIIKYLDPHASSLRYCISADDDYWWYSRDMFEVIGDDEIKVGDEVIFNRDAPFKVIVTCVKHSGGKPLDYTVMANNGLMWDYVKPNEITKTGRTFPQIAEVLKQLQEGEE